MRVPPTAARFVAIVTRFVAIVLVFGPTAGLSGCASLGKPAWLDPGPARSQQRRSVRFDPFQQTDVRHDHLSTMDGTRPRDYAEPVAEVKRPRWWRQPTAVSDSPIYR